MKGYTPFYNKHLEYGGKEMGFAELGTGLSHQMGELPGEEITWQVPWVYTSAEEEYKMVRERAGFSDSSYMVQWLIVGKDALNFVQKMFVNDFNKISPGKILYSPIVNETGQIIREASIFWIEDHRFLFVTGADLGGWLKQYAQGMDVYLTRMSYSMLALQGPKSRDILQKAVNVKDLPYLGLMQGVINGIPSLIGRFGATGELGYELYIRPEYAPKLWDTLIELGKDYGCGPFGLMAAYPLYVEKGYLTDSEYYEGATPLELGYRWAVAFDKGDFIGKEALVRRKKEGLRTKLMGFEVSDPKSVVAEGDNVVKEGRAVGKLTVVIDSPFMGRKIGKVWVEIGRANIGERLEVEHGKERVEIKLVRGRWYDPEDKKIKG